MARQSRGLTCIKLHPAFSTTSTTKAFWKKILDGLAEANPECVLYQHKRNTDSDISLFFDEYKAACTFDDSTDLSQEWVVEFLEDYVEDIVLSPELCRKVEMATRGQSVNPLWVTARRFLLTASNFGP